MYTYALSFVSISIDLLEQDIIEGENPIFDLNFTVNDAPSKSRVDRDYNSKWVDDVPRFRTD
jgi:hypothetical protein